MTELTQSELQRREAVDRERQRQKDLGILVRRIHYLDSLGEDGNSFDRAEASALRRSIERLEESA